MRKSGILLPITSLPSSYGVGSFSKSAYDFVDFLADCGQSLWQILPLGPTGFGNSPYQSFSAFAGNPYMISLNDLIKEGVLSESECDSADLVSCERAVDYAKLYSNKLPLLKLAYKRSHIYSDNDYIRFINENKFWLDDYALFMAIKDSLSGCDWQNWPDDIRRREIDAINKYTEQLKEEIDFYKYIQYKFSSQWQKLKKYANEKGVDIIGDMPIYLSSDSADVWANPNLFCLDTDMRPTFVAGCPPDYFSEEGQLWGNPLYDWDAHRVQGFEWWVSRIRHNLVLCDYLRIDHFRGFDEFYSIPYGDKNAKRGRWIKAPGRELFDIIRNRLGNINIIAEDLGYITDSVRDLLRHCGFMGIKVLQFAFSDDGNTLCRDYLPHNYPQNCVAYTGTHDNPPLSAWFTSISKKGQAAVRDYLCDNHTPDNKMYAPLISLVMRSSAGIVITPIQDFMGCGEESRLNTPSTLGANWSWRLTKDDLTDTLKDKILKITKYTERQ